MGTRLEPRQESTTDDHNSDPGATRSRPVNGQNLRTIQLPAQWPVTAPKE